MERLVEGDVEQPQTKVYNKNKFLINCIFFQSMIIKVPVDQSKKLK